MMAVGCTSVLSLLSCALALVVVSFSVPQTSLRRSLPTSAAVVWLPHRFPWGCHQPAIACMLSLQIAGPVSPSPTPPATPRRTAAPASSYRRCTWRRQRQGASALSQVRSKAWRFLATIPRCLSDAVAMHQHRPQNEATSAKFAASDAATTRKMQTLEDRLNKTGVTRTTSVALYRLQCLQRLLQRNPGLRRIFSSCLRTRQLTRACTAKFTQNTAPGPRNATDNSQTKESSL